MTLPLWEASPGPAVFLLGGPIIEIHPNGGVPNRLSPIAVNLLFTEPKNHVTNSN